MKFDTKSLKQMSLADLHYYCGKAKLSQGNGPAFSQMLENRIIKLEREINNRVK
jgi:hypothetical protein